MSYVTEGNKIRALYDIKVFADLIEFKGGWKNFGTLHKKLVGFVTAPQTVRLRKGKVKLGYYNRRLLLVPRGHLKSTVSSVLYVLWRIYRNPNIRILVGTNLKTLAQSFIRELRQYLENPELQESVWNARPHITGRLVPVMDAAGRKRRSQKGADEETDTEDKKLIWTIDALQVLRTETLKEPTVLATSLGTRVTGQHYDLLVLDDVVDFDNSTSEDKKTKVIEWAGDMESVLDPAREVYCGEHKTMKGNSISRVEKTELTEAVGDEVVMLGTRYEDGDLYDYTMMNMKEFEYKVFTRNIHRNGQNWVKPTNTEEEYKESRREYRLGDESGGYIWSEKFNADSVRRLKARLTPRRWASQYLNTILNVGESILDAEKVRYYRSGLVKVENGLVKVYVPGEDLAPRLLRPIITVDLAVSQKSSADNTAMVVGGQDEDGNLIVVDAKVNKQTIDKQVEQFFELCEKWGVTKAVIETVGYQGAFVQLVKNEFHKRKPVFVVEFRPVGEKKARLETGLQPYFANGMLYLPDWMATHTIIQDEITLFPRDGAKDDFLDALDTMRLHSQRIPRDSRKLLPKQPATNRKWGGIR